MDRDITGEALKCHTVTLVETRLSPHGDQEALDGWEMPSSDASVQPHQQWGHGSCLPTSLLGVSGPTSPHAGKDLQ